SVGSAGDRSDADRRNREGGRKQFPGLERHVRVSCVLLPKRTAWVVRSIEERRRSLRDRITSDPAARSAPIWL
ncbi:hypothetical protein KXV85_005053, partial [Aspergillus fumigatus]